MRSLFALFLAVFAFAFAPAQAQHTLNVRDADIRAFVTDAARVTGRTFIVDSRVQGKVSVVTDRPLSRSEYFEIFLSTPARQWTGRHSHIPRSLSHPARRRSR